jgi:PAS domain S-box-containing protein
MLPAGAYTCDADGLITYFNRQVAEIWGREPKLYDPVDRYCGSFKLFSPHGHPIEHDRCWMALALQQDAEYNGQEIVIQRPGGERVTVLAHANPIHDELGRLVGAVNILVDITKQKQAEEATKSHNAALVQQVSQRKAALGILHDVALAANEANSVEDAILVALREICDYKDLTLGHAWLRSEDQGELFRSSRVWYSAPRSACDAATLREFQRSTEQTAIPLAGAFIGKVSRTAEPLCTDYTGEFAGWLRPAKPANLGLNAAIAFPARVHGDVIAVLEFFSERPFEYEAGFLGVMADVGIQLGHIFERKRLEKAIADATSAQQRRIASELHDSVSQLLSGAAMISESLRQALCHESSPHVDLATRLVGHLSHAQQQVRRVSRGLMPVDADATGLMRALEQLARQSPDLYNASCHFRCDVPVLIDDNAVATQLYYIAREALYNAVKYAHAEAIVVRLDRDQQSIRMWVQDDGQGISDTGRSSGGMGMSIMRYRANVLGAKLDVVSSMGRGTQVICTLPLGH